MMLVMEGLAVLVGWMLVLDGVVEEGPAELIAKVVMLRVHLQLVGMQSFAYMVAWGAAESGEAAMLSMKSLPDLK